MRYEIKGGSFPIVVCQLESGEQMITEKGSMVWMTPNMQMDTRGGGLGKMFAKAFSGESMFQNIYAARGQGMITFGSSFPGQIKAVEIDGELVEYELGPGEQLVVDTGNVAGFTAGVQMDIQAVSGVKNALLGGEGLFNTILTGPGKVWLQTMPICSVAMSIRPYIPTGNG